MNGCRITTVSYHDNITHKKNHKGEQHEAKNPCNLYVRNVFIL